MMRHISFALLFVVACGGSPLDPGSGNDPGTGTKTLVVTGGASATPQVPLAKTAADFSTDFEIQIELNNTPVQTGTVTITTSAGKVPLAFATDRNAWRGTDAGYEEVYQLDVDTGTDNVHGVRIDGPDIHTITSPTAAASVDSTMAINLAWARDNAADTAALDAHDLIDNGGLTMNDSGSFTIPPLTLKADKSQSRQGTLRVTRTNRVAPAGAATGSLVTVSIENSVDVVVLANPNAP